MKCVIKIGTDKVRRVKDDLAVNLVHNLRSHVFVPKWQWKEQQGLPYRGSK